MAKSSPFNFDISVSADKKRRAKGRSSSRGMSGAFDTSNRACDHPGCENSGKYRAPKSQDNLDEFYWFCLEHVRAYNLKWNFFENHSDAELEEQFSADKVWERPTKPFKDTLNAYTSKHPNSEEAAWKRFGIDDPMEVLGENATQNRGRTTNPMERRLPPTEAKAIRILEAEATMTKSEIRKQYKSLVKDLHPDMNGGNRNDEDRLQEVVWAWDQVKASKIFKD